MGASSSCCFSTAKAKESPSTVVDVVGEFEALTMVGVEGTSTSGRSEYYSARCDAMQRSRDQFSDDVALEIEFSKSHWSEVVRVEVVPQSPEDEELNRKNRDVLEQFRREFPSLFHRFRGRFVLGRMIAEGGQAQIYEVVGNPKYLMKVFKRGTSLQDLRQLWPLPVLKREVFQCIVMADMLEDGRFAFLMDKCWGDLRKLIDQAMKEKNVNGMQGPPFPYKWEYHHPRIFYSTDFMLGIARHIMMMHDRCVSHRDLKTANILLLTNDGHSLYTLRNEDMLLVADYECSIGVLGTGFWRAPEIFLAQDKRETLTNEQWEKADVYSYGMTCFEIVTGRIPFDGELRNTKAHRQLVIDGKRPQLPRDLDERVKDLITRCWESNPRLRPTFLEIVDVVKTISKRQ